VHLLSIVIGDCINNVYHYRY